ncbi:MAG: T9SS type A sorting domain-containing protein, partial [Fimbriimonadaceae bacterium]|nr:T9SS type A sorting domain-containing protein [Chitinophagales bacterium]
TETITNLSPGDYIVTVTDAAGCSSTATVTVDLSESIYDLQNSNAFTIYPNPIQDGFIITPNENISGSMKIEMLNAKGQLILEKNFDNTNAQFINTENFTSGMYVIKMITDNKMYLKSLVIQ